MGRAILAAITGYVVMAVTAVAGIGLTWLIFGADGAFRDGETVASTQWSVTNCVFGFVAAVVGGLAAAAIDKTPDRLGTKFLMGIVLGLGMLIAFLSLNVEPKPLPDGKSISDLSFMEAGEVATSPMWYNFVIPLIGTTGVLVGSRFIRPAAPEMLIADNAEQTSGQV